MIIQTPKSHDHTNSQESWSDMPPRVIARPTMESLGQTCHEIAVLTQRHSLVWKCRMEGDLFVGRAMWIVVLHNAQTRSGIGNETLCIVRYMCTNHQCVRYYVSSYSSTATSVSQSKPCFALMCDGCNTPHKLATRNLT